MKIDGQRPGPTRSTTSKTSALTGSEQKTEVKFKAAQAKAKRDGVDTLTEEDIKGLSSERIKQLRGTSASSPDPTAPAASSRGGPAKGCAGSQWRRGDATSVPTRSPWRTVGGSKGRAPPGQIVPKGCIAPRASASAEARFVVVWWVAHPRGGLMWLLIAAVFLMTVVSKTMGKKWGKWHSDPKKQTLPVCYARNWRRGRDSNPRDGCPPTHFPGVRLRPLGHPS
jgi:hypothetical protein